MIDGQRGLGNCKTKFMFQKQQCHANWFSSCLSFFNHDTNNGHSVQV